jgi:PadR family transcriptional regulator, regulatory protein AphA
MSRTLSTTGYAVLGMLALRPATPYEITQQMQRSLDYCWPTSERSLYDQPERLVAAGFASVSVEDEGASARRRYAITAAGRAALQDWLATRPALPRFQNEPLLRVLFADQGTVEDLHRVLEDVRTHIAQRRRLGLAQLEPYRDGDGLFQERAHIVVLVADLISRLMATVDDWAVEVERIVAAWDSTRDGMTDATRELLERLIESEHLRTLDDAGAMPVADNPTP